MLESVIEVVDAQVMAQEVEERSGVDRARAGRHRDALERCEAHRRVDGTPVSNRRDRAAAAQVADHEARDGHLLARPLDREPMEAEAADSELAKLEREGIGRRPIRDRLVEGGVEDRDVGECGNACRASRIASSAGALCSGASSVSPSSSSSTASSTNTDSRKREPPCTTRWATASTSPGASASDDTFLVSPSVPTTESLRLTEPALTTRTAATRQYGQTQSRISGSSSPCSRVYARARRRRSLISWRR